MRSDGMEARGELEVLRWTRALRGNVFDAIASESCSKGRCLVACFDTLPSTWTRRRRTECHVEHLMETSYDSKDVLSRLRPKMTEWEASKQEFVLVLDTFDSLLVRLGKRGSAQVLSDLRGFEFCSRMILFVHGDGLETSTLRWIDSMADRVVEILPPLDGTRADASLRRARVRHGRVDDCHEDVVLEHGKLVPVRERGRSNASDSIDDGRSERKKWEGTSLSMRLDLRPEEREARSRVTLPHEQEATALRSETEDFRSWLPPQAGGIVHYTRDSDTEQDTDDDPDDDLDV